MNVTSTWIKLCCVAIVVFCLTRVSSAQNQFPVVVAKRDIPASKKLASNDVEVQKRDASRVPPKSLPQVLDVVGKTVNKKIFAGEVILQSHLTEAVPQVPPARNTRLVSIPVSISTKYQLGELVRLVYESPDGNRETIVDETKVFHIGEPNALQDDAGGTPVFVRYVSVVATLEDAEKIARSMDTRRGIHILEKLGQPANKETTTTSRRQADPVPGPTTAQRSANTQRPSRRTQPSSVRVLPSSSQAFSDQLRQMARALETQAAELEERAEFKQADLIRAACQNLREAARIDSGR